MNIINNNSLLREIRRMIKEELKKEIPKNQVDAIWKYLNEIAERLKCLERGETINENEKRI